MRLLVPFSVSFCLDPDIHCQNLLKHASEDILIVFRMISNYAYLVCYNLILLFPSRGILLFAVSF